MALSPEEIADLNRQARRRAERAAEEMSFRGVSSEDYLRRLRAKRRPGRKFEVGDIPAAVEIGEEPLPPGPEFVRPTAPGRYHSQSQASTKSGLHSRGPSTSDRPRAAARDFERRDRAREQTGATLNVQFCRADVGIDIYSHTTSTPPDLVIFKRLLF
ncbi:hypothetical protein CCHL11_06578 [Colletotrichum chlorophyti]|uniref:Uncharacterized protein n=1 Tax=Colletotrichum chlorophyti TaxID=708187 RepID=A0A1Q8RXY4_9PEZI|nr:hypothetical protein CCHL11_06578 [Colletotrichum chlorophyti]